MQYLHWWCYSWISPYLCSISAAKWTRSGLVSLSSTLSNDICILWSSVRYQLFIFKYIKFINYLYANVFKCKTIHHKNLCLKRRKYLSHPRLWNLVESHFSMMTPCNVFLDVFYFCIWWSWWCPPIWLIFLSHSQSYSATRVMF
jgi:hypothetical protein